MTAHVDLPDVDPATSNRSDREAPAARRWSAGRSVTSVAWSAGPSCSLLLAGYRAAVPLPVRVADRREPQTQDAGLRQPAHPADRACGATTRRSSTSCRLLHWLFNSVAIAVLAAGLVAVSSSVVAFGFAYFKFPGRGTAVRSRARHDDAAGIGHHDPDVPDLEGPRPARHVGAAVRCEPVRLGVLHLPAAAVLSRPAARAVRGGPPRRRQLLAAVLARSRCRCRSRRSSSCSSSSSRRAGTTCRAR